MAIPRLLSAVALVMLLGVAHGIEDSCGACKFIADDVSKRLDAEKDDQLDLRHRLGADGKPYGKVVDFKLSELRIVKLLEHMCSSLSQHHDFNTTSGYWEFIYKPYAMHRTLERKTHQQKFDNFCSSLLEEVEDDLADALIEGEVDSQGIVDYLCIDNTLHCTPKQVKEVTKHKADLDEIDRNDKINVEKQKEEYRKEEEQRKREEEEKEKLQSSTAEGSNDEL